MNALFASPVYANYARIIADEKFALDTAEECASPMPLASLIRDRFLSAVAFGQAESDWSSLARISARNAGL